MITTTLTPSQLQDLWDWHGVDRIPDTDVLERVKGMGPAIVGYDLFERAEYVRERTNNGVFGPALTDPDYGKKEAARIAAARAARERAKAGVADEPESAVAVAVSDADPWSFITISGAKMLAQQHGVSYQPRVKRAVLIDALKLAGVQPPEPPANPDADDGFTEFR